MRQQAECDNDKKYVKYVKKWLKNMSEFFIMKIELHTFSKLKIVLQKKVK